MFGAFCGGTDGDVHGIGFDKHGSSMRTMPPPPAGKAARTQTAALVDAEPAPPADDADPMADGLDRGAVVALLASARSK